jgi:hypothetical protein
LVDQAVPDLDKARAEFKQIGADGGARSARARIQTEARRDCPIKGQWDENVQVRDERLEGSTIRPKQDSYEIPLV